MTIELTPEDQKLVEEKLSSGAFRDLEELIHRPLVSLPVQYARRTTTQSQTKRRANEAFFCPDVCVASRRKQQPAMRSCAEWAPLDPALTLQQNFKKMRAHATGNALAPCLRKSFSSRGPATHGVQSTSPFTLRQNSASNCDARSRSPRSTISTGLCM